MWIDAPFWLGCFKSDNKNEMILDSIASRGVGGGGGEEREREREWKVNGRKREQGVGEIKGIVAKWA